VIIRPSTRFLKFFIANQKTVRAENFNGTLKMGRLFLRQNFFRQFFTPIFLRQFFMPKVKKRIFTPKLKKTHFYAKNVFYTKKLSNAKNI